MRRPTTKQIVDAWYSIADEYAVRINKVRADGKYHEVIVIHPDGDIVVLHADPDHDHAVRVMEKLEDDASAKAVLRLFQECLYLATMETSPRRMPSRTKSSSAGHRGVSE